MSANASFSASPGSEGAHASASASASASTDGNNCQRWSDVHLETVLAHSSKEYLVRGTYGAIYKITPRPDWLDEQRGQGQSSSASASASASASSGSYSSGSRWNMPTEALPSFCLKVQFNHPRKWSLQLRNPHSGNNVEAAFLRDWNPGFIARRETPHLLTAWFVTRWPWSRIETAEECRARVEAYRSLQKARGQTPGESDTEEDESKEDKMTMGDVYRPDELVQILVMPYTSMPSLELLLPRLSQETILVVVFQVLWTLRAMLHHCPSFRHNDLSHYNVLLFAEPSSATYRVEEGGGKESESYTLPEVGICAKLADFDCAHIARPSHPGEDAFVNDKTISFAGEWGIHDRPNQLADVHYFLLSLRLLCKLCKVPVQLELEQNMYTALQLDSAPGADPVVANEFTETARLMRDSSLRADDWFGAMSCFQHFHTDQSSVAAAAVAAQGSAPRLPIQVFELKGRSTLRDRSLAAYALLNTTNRPGSPVSIAYAGWQTMIRKFDALVRKNLIALAAALLKTADLAPTVCDTHRFVSLFAYCWFQRITEARRQMTTNIEVAFRVFLVRTLLQEAPVSCALTFNSLFGHLEPEEQFCTEAIFFDLYRHL